MLFCYRVDVCFRYLLSYGTLSYAFRSTANKMDSPSSTKSRGSRRNSFIELLKPEMEKMYSNCKKYRQEIKSLRDETTRLRSEKRQLEYRKEQDDLKHKNEIMKLNELVDDLRYQISMKENVNHLPKSHPVNSAHHHKLDKYAANHNAHHQLNNAQPNNLVHHLNSLPNNLPNKFFNKNVLNDSYKQLIGSTMNNWMQTSNKKFKSELNEKVESAKRQFLISLENEVEMIIEQLTTTGDEKRRRNGYANKKKSNLLNEFNVDDQFTVQVNPELKLALKPLKGIIESINLHFDNKKSEIANKIDELEETQRNLESSLNRTRIADASFQNERLAELIEKIELVEEENQKLRDLNDRLNDVNGKLKEDNKELCANEIELKEEIDDLRDKLKKQREQMNQLSHDKLDLQVRVAELTKQNELNMELKEQTILGKIKKDNENLVKELNNKFSELIDDLKGNCSFFCRIFCLFS